jgi:hypothetical protein
MQMAFTVESPMCWLTSAVIVSVTPSSERSTVIAKPISGSALGGNSTSRTGPVTVRMRPSLVAPRSGMVRSSVMAMLSPLPVPPR